MRCRRFTGGPEYPDIIIIDKFQGPGNIQPFGDLGGKQIGEEDIDVLRVVRIIREKIEATFVRKYFVQVFCIIGRQESAEFHMVMFAGRYAI